MIRIKKYSEYISEGTQLTGNLIPALTGKMLAGVAKGIKSFGNRISLSGNDEDLAKNVEKYVDGLPEAYDADTRYGKGKIHRQGNTDYFVIYGKEIFPNAKGTEFRVDIIKASDPSLGLHKDPYRILISKIRPAVKKPSGDGIGTVRRQDPAAAARRGFTGPEVGSLSTPNANKAEDFVHLDCSQSIAKKIFDKIKHKWELTNPNTKGVARGNQNTNKPQPGKIGRLTWW